ncbi:DUF5662 family protein [Pseudomonadales bacterium]|nr:DUF5662 family protein [Pseudomonadales bacterium]
MNNMKNFDSTAKTLEHKRDVQILLNQVAIELIRRGNVHDDSKLQEPEKSIFDASIPKLSALTYGTDEYHKARVELGEALKHHYANNSHHPEYYGLPTQLNERYIEEVKLHKERIDEFNDELEYDNVPFRIVAQPLEFSGGINDMGLLDIVEMLCDWLAAIKKHDDGNIEQSMAHNKKRFGISDQLHKIMWNTIKELEKQVIDDSFGERDFDYDYD